MEEKRDLPALLSVLPRGEWPACGQGAIGEKGRPQEDALAEIRSRRHCGQEYRLTPLKEEERDLGRSWPSLLTSADSAMEKIRTWLSKKGFELFLKPKVEDSVDFGERCVNINSSDTYYVRLGSALHECGHILIFLARCRNPVKRFSGSTLKEQCFLKGRRQPRSRRFRIACLQEELDAWDRGLDLAVRLGIRVNKKVLEKDRIKALMTYVGYAAAPMRVSR